MALLGGPGLPFLKSSQITHAHRKLTEQRKRQAQLDSIIGAACRAEEPLHEFVRAALDKHFREPKQRAFLKAEGWLS